MSVTPYGIQNNLQNVYIYIYIIKSNCAVDILRNEHIRINTHQSLIFVPYLYTRMFQ